MHQLTVKINIIGQQSSLSEVRIAPCLKKEKEKKRQGLYSGKVRFSKLQKTRLLSPIVEHRVNTILISNYPYNR